MKLNYVLLADHAFLSIDKKVNIIGIFETINAQKFPVTHPKFVIIGSIEPSKETFKMSVSIVDSAGKSLLNNANEKDISLPAQTNAKNFNFIIEMINSSFPKAGDYAVQIMVDGEKVGEQKLRVLESSKASGISLSDIKPS